MKINEEKDVARWLAKQRLKNFQEVIYKSEDLAFDTLCRGRAGFDEYDDQDILEEIEIWHLKEQAIEDGILIPEEGYREFITQCPECGELDSLEVIIGKFWCSKMMLHPDGFDFFEAKEVHTEDEIVRCQKCENQFDLEELKYEEDENDH